VFSSDSNAKFSEACCLDKKTGLFHINEAFTFDLVNELAHERELINSNETLSIYIELLNYPNNEFVGKVNLTL